MFKISVYGKGGIGKSTISSNLSYIFSVRGRKVMHVGCDPKHDSTRLLTDGVSQRTFMDSLIEDSEEGIIETGSNGIACVECGGAEPGIGCAGKGMISLFNFIERNTPEDTDIRVCDVLGDVVCGGFSVPMRRKQTDGIVLVVSEEFMSIYAANNILRGIRNLNATECVLGLVLNSRVPEDRFRIDEFSRATGIPVLGIISKDRLFSDAESAGKTVAELFPDSSAYGELSSVADRILEVIDGKGRRFRASPLNDNAMMQIAAKQTVTDLEPPQVRVRCRFDSIDRDRGMKYKGNQAMPACTSHGAVEVLLSIRDAAIVLHGPRNCAFLMEYAWMRRSTLMKKGRGSPLPDNIYTTSMDADTVFTGDSGILRKSIRKAAEDGFGTVFVVQTCTPDTIGTDAEDIAKDLEIPGCTVIPVETDEYFLGGRFGAFRGAFKAIKQCIEWRRPAVKGRVGILAFEPNYLSEASNLEIIHEILGVFGLSLGMVLTDNITMEDIRDIGTCEYYVRLGWGRFSEIIAETVLPEGTETVMLEPPTFLTGIEEWSRKLGSLTGQHFIADSYIRRKREEFEERVGELRGRYSGKKAVFYQRRDVILDPYLDALDFLGFEVASWISWKDHFETPERPPSRGDSIPKMGEVELCHLGEVLDDIGADLVISGDPRTGRIGRPWIGMGSRFLGIDGLEDWVWKIDNCMKMVPIQKWKEMRI